MTEANKEDSCTRAWCHCRPGQIPFHFHFTFLPATVAHSAARSDHKRAGLQSTGTRQLFGNRKFKTSSWSWDKNRSKLGSSSPRPPALTVLDDAGIPLHPCVLQPPPPASDLLLHGSPISLCLTGTCVTPLRVQTDNPG